MERKEWKRSVGSHPLEAAAENRKWFDEHYESVFKDSLYSGLWVAIKDGVIIDCGDHHAILNAKIIASQGGKANLVTIISAIPRKT